MLTAWYFATGSLIFPQFPTNWSYLVDQEYYHRPHHFDLAPDFFGKHDYHLQRPITSLKLLFCQIIAQYLLKNGKFTLS